MVLINLVIAEDSKPIVRHMKSLLETMELPLRLVATAANGEEALEVLRRESVQLLLTDIRMPKMDGLTLIEQAKQLNPQLKVVLISGYSDFEYTRKALNLQVFDYLLKPVERGALADVMQRAIGQLMDQSAGEYEQLKHIIDPAAAECMKDQEAFVSVSKLMFVLHRQPFANGEPEEEQEVVQNLLQGFAASMPCLVARAKVPQEWIAFIDRGILNGYSSIYECLETMRRTLSQQGLEFTIGGQLLTAEAGRLTDIYYRMSGLVEEHQRLMQGSVLDTGALVAQTPPTDDTLESAKALALSQMIREQRKDQFILKLTEQMANWTDSQVRLAEVKQFIGVIVETFAQQFEEKGLDSRRELELAGRRLFKTVSYEVFCCELLEWAKLCFEKLQSFSRTSSQELFEQLDEYVKVNLYSQLSISDIAGRFHVSPSYISRIIKKYTQITFVQYYTGLKINEACRLLEDKPEMKFRELAELLSFSDQHYFSKVFKEYTGFSPTEYREQLLSLPQAEQ